MQRIQQVPMPARLQVIMMMGMMIALVGMQLDLRHHEDSGFDGYFEWQHLVIYSGIAMYGISAMHPVIRRIEMTLPDKIAIGGFAAMIAGGLADMINHQFICHCFDSLLSWSHVPFGIGFVVSSIAVAMSLYHTRIRFIGFGVAVMSVLALGMILMTHDVPAEPSALRPMLTWIGVFGASYVIARVTRT